MQAQLEEEDDSDEDETMPLRKALRQQSPLSREDAHDQYKVEGGIWPDSQSDSDSDWELARSPITALDTNIKRRFQDVYNDLQSKLEALK
uniref:Uncharacterized protein n=1 Tax=uncultured organism MedDCM-OCT-S08-C695 TaxID=743640 RepID=D6PJB4_9ZZZZ|nr:hypothetical protein [uncultured organism MedDCM-OCT-S08-C695]